MGVVRVSANYHHHHHMTLICENKGCPEEHHGTAPTLEGLALDQVEVVGLLQDAALEATAKALQVSAINIEHVPGHFYGFSLHCLSRDTVWEDTRWSIAIINGSRG